MLIAHVFGKTGCAKCAVLQKRLDSILEKDEFKNKFVKEYDNVLTEEGLLKFCRVQCVNPNKIPALVISDQDGNFLEGEWNVKAPYTYQYLGIQTDYSETGKGILQPELIEEILRKALDKAV